MAKQELVLVCGIVENQLPHIFGNDESDKTIEKLLVEIEAEHEPEVFDMTTQKGRDICRKAAAEVGRKKSALDKAAESKKKQYTFYSNKIQEERNLIKGRMQTLQHKVRKPLTEYEDAEKSRIATLEANIEAIRVDSEGMTAEQMRIATADLVMTPIGDEWEEFKSKALEAKEAEIQRLRPLYESIKENEDNAVKLAELEAKEAERKQAEHESKIAREAEAKAKAEAEKQLQAERLDFERKQKLAEQEKKELVLKIEQEKLKKEQARINATKAKEQAIARAEQNARNAVIAEKKRVADELEEIEVERAKREADIKNRNKVLLESREDLMANGIDKELAGEIVKLIYTNKIRNITVSF